MIIDDDYEIFTANKLWLQIPEGVSWCDDERKEVVLTIQCTVSFMCKQGVTLHNSQLSLFVCFSLSVASRHSSRNMENYSNRCPRQHVACLYKGQWKHSHNQASEDEVFFLMCKKRSCPMFVSLFVPFSHYNLYRNKATVIQTMIDTLTSAFPTFQKWNEMRLNGSIFYSSFF